jgi:hypothetical protein
VLRERVAFDLYAELSVDVGASRAEIRSAFRRAAKEVHPDVSATAAAHERMVRLNLAAEILLDPTRRAEYDRDRGGRGGSDGSTSRRRGRRAAKGRAWGLTGCPVCGRAAGPGLHHCALGHVAPSPIFGSPRSFHVAAERHGSGRDFATREDEVRHADACNWFGEWNAYGPAPFPSVPRIRRDAGVAIDPEIYRSLLGVASRAAVDAAYEYAADGRVVLVVDRGTTLAGIVCGRFAYGARIGIDGTDGRCTCPSWRAPCKHPLALWLVHRLVPTAASISGEALEPS